MALISNHCCACSIAASAEQRSSQREAGEAVKLFAGPSACGMESRPRSLQMAWSQVGYRDESLCLWRNYAPAQFSCSCLVNVIMNMSALMQLNINALHEF